MCPPPEGRKLTSGTRAWRRGPRTHSHPVMAIHRCAASAPEISPIHLLLNGRYSSPDKRLFIPQSLAEKG